MADIESKLKKLREERIAREKARIEKLRELNLKKYTKIEQPTNAPQHPAKLLKSNSVTSIKSNMSVAKNVKNNFHVNGTTKRPITAPTTKKPDFSNVKAKVMSKINEKSDVKALNQTTDIKLTSNHTTDMKTISNQTSDIKTTSNQTTDIKTTTNQTTKAKIESEPSSSNSSIEKKIPEKKVLKIDKPTQTHPQKVSKIPEKKVLTEIKVLKEMPKANIKNLDFRRKSFMVPASNDSNDKKARKSMLPKLPEKTESVFERLYKPKKIESREPNLLKKAVKNSTVNKRHTLFEKANAPILSRRSISAIHFKKISKNEIFNCIHKWASIGEKLDKVDLEVNEDDKIQEDKLVSAIKSERKKVTFMTPIPNLNTPRPEELQSRLKSWLQKRGKSLESYHHLQCFGINHMRSGISTPKFSERLHDEENKENIALDSDSDDGSFSEMNEGKEATNDKIDIYNWRKASFDSESVGFNESVNLNETTLTAETANVDELLIGALNDLTALLREGFDWQQSARWLRSIRSRFPHAPRTAAYWECRAALEDSRGDLPASVHCWQEAVAKGTEHSVVESNLDQLLDKFMQLKISPKTGASRQPDPKLVDVKNVFKSTIIRFAVQQAKLRQSTSGPVYTLTPVRRSGRLSHCATRGVCDSVTQAPDLVFTHNQHLLETP